jgi:exodeoxyribonuclease VII large subunit
MSIKPDVFTVTEVNRHISNVIESNIPGLHVEGEIANFTHHSSGHMYFSLKDEKSTLRCVFFKPYNLYLTFKPKDGEKVICVGKITVYEKSGNYQLKVSRLIAVGLGDLQRRFEELRQKLDEEGLFSAVHKKPLPVFPEKIGVITSATGAAIQDIQNILIRRFPVKIFLYPAVVQGDIAAPSIIRGINFFNENFPVDVLIIGRGGGSQEDLFCFNDEKLARAIFSSKIPIISAVGHEIDFTISDFVADLRAPTPSAAAELAVPDRKEILNRVDNLHKNMLLTTGHQLFSFKMDVHDLDTRLAEYHPKSVLQSMEKKLAEISQSLIYNVKLLLAMKHSHLDIIFNELKELSPAEALKRGYAFILKERKLLNSVKNVEKDEKLELMLSDGRLEAKVLAIEKNKK